LHTPHGKKNHKIERTSDPKKSRDYQAPALYTGIFYILLVAWTVFCVILIGSRATQAGWPVGQLLIIGFVLAYTWYFSLGISYKISLGDDGLVFLTSFRKILKMSAGEIETMEGPHFPIGFIRFRLKREKAYLFSLINDKNLKRILSRIRSLNPDIKLKGLMIPVADRIDS
jgi:hypothetical protein